MRLTFDRGPRDQFVIGEHRRDDGPLIVSSGESFEVDDEHGRRLLALYYPAIKPATS